MITYLQANTTDFTTIAYAPDMQPIDDMAQQTPAAYLYQHEESARLPDGDGYIAQEVTQVVNVFIVARHRDMAALRATLRQLLLNYQVDSAHTPMWFMAGASQRIAGEYQWWLDSYQTLTHYRES